MMKRHRLVSILLLMAVCLASCATSLAEMDVYANPTNGYQISYPANWTILNRETIDAIMKLVMGGHIPGIDGSVLEQYSAQIQQMDAVMFITPSGDMSAIIYEDAHIPLMSTLLKTMVCPQVIAQYRLMFDEIEVLDPGSILQIGDNEFVFLSMVVSPMGEKTQIDLYLYSQGKVVYTMAFSAEDPNTKDILASFVPGK